MSGKIKAHRAPLLPSVIEELRRKGFNQSQIADMHGVSRQAVSWQKKTYGGFVTPREIVREAWPFVTTNAHTKSTPYQRLRDHGEYMAQGSFKDMSDLKVRRLKAWWRKLHDEDVVLEFDPSIPAGPGMAGGGFRYVPRVVEDEDLLIRVNEHTTLSVYGETIWAWPPDIENLLAQP
ncbi:immunity repressor [Mycobacterium phage Yecey3]|uniref:Immunity repressor n=1 Tax=Mycobacterium phage Yecey3 TaxID=2656617 RepID=A0A649V936_9CAUD|nr:transcriptional repressor [Mycobacterium phage Yecey3]QGJ88830.1 immunity repressor [Mycobacterium phage Yecey3]